MPPARLPENEAERLAALGRLEILDSPSGEEFDSLVEVAALICGTPIALISLVDQHRQWLKANTGLPGVTETPRDVAFCAYAILGDDLLEVEDATTDPRFSDNALVNGQPAIRFYAGMPLRLSDGHNIGCICVVDRTPRTLSAAQRQALRHLGRIAARALEGSHARLVRAELTERLSLATEGCGVGIWDWDVAADRMTWDPVMYRLYGATPGIDIPTVELWQRHLHPDDHEEALRRVKEALAGGRAFEPDFRVVRDDGSIRHIQGVCTVKRDAAGQPVRMIGTNWDVTPRVRAEAALRESEARMRLMDGVADHAVYLLDPEGRVSNWNPGAALIKGYTTEQIIGQSYEIFFTEEDRAAGEPARVLAATIRQRHFHGEGWRVRRDGTRFWARVALTAVLDDTGTLRGFAKVAQDLTEQRLAEEQRAILIESAPNGMLMLDAAGIITLANSQARAFFGYQRGAMIGLSVDMLVPQAARQPHGPLHAALAAGPGGDMTPLQLDACRYDGSIVPVEMLLRSVCTPHGNMVVASVFDATERLEREQERGAAKQTELAAAGAANARLEQLARHLERARDQAQQANEAKSRFLASISHELRTPLNGILGYAQLLRLEGGLQPAQAAKVDEMLSAGEHLLGMINAVLDLSQIESDRLELQSTAIPVAGFAQQCLGVVRPTAAIKSLKLRLMISPDAPPTLMADATRLRQALVNLLGNAVKFTETGSVELRLLQADSDARLRIEVADTGPGIAAANAEKLFHEFARLRSGSVNGVEGSGLGLAITARLVQRMRGTIGYFGNPGGGSVFWLEMPVGEVPCATTLQVVEQPKPVGEVRPLRILVVDDVEMNRKIAGAFLKLGGHDVTFAEGGEAAVAAVASAGFDLVLMDVQMPGVDGLQATRRIRALPPPRGNVQVIAMTAQAFADQIERCMEAGMNGHVSKPLEHAALLAMVTNACSKGMPARVAVEAPPRDEAPLLDEAAFLATGNILSAADLDEYVALLIARSRTLQTRLRRAETPAELAALEPAVHELRGSAGTFGFRRLNEVASVFERAASHDSPLLADLGDALDSVLMDTIGVMENLEHRRFQRDQRPIKMLATTKG